MKSHDRRRSGAAAGAGWVYGVMALFSLLLPGPSPARAATITGGSDTVFRLRASHDRDIYPLYEYLNLSVAQPAKDGQLTFTMGGWGRLDLADETTEEHTAGDLQYGYLSYRGNRGNFRVKLGRVYLTEGVANDRVDGAYLGSDLAHGVSVAAFAGRPVVTEPNALSGGDLLYGARVAHGVRNLYTLGLSALKTSQSDARENRREEEAIDLWLRPAANLDITGISSYSTASSGWMEHSYRLSYNPSPLRISAELSRIDYRNYFHQVTTPALSLANGILSPGEELLILGGSVGCPLPKNLDLVADYRHYDYETRGDAHYFGGKLTYLVADAYSAGIMIHRMEGGTQRLKYLELRGYATRKLGKADFTLDLFDVAYDSDINGVGNAFSVSAVAGYQFAANLRGTADIEYQTSPDYDNRVQGLVKLIYAFDLETGRQGRSK